MKENNKIYKKIALGILIVFICCIISIPSKSVKAENIINYDDEVKILEIEPGNKFLLGDSNAIGDLQQQEVAVSGSSQKIKVRITHLSMPQYISMIDDINGKYDIVVVGRKIDNIGENMTKGGANMYSDYTNPFSKKKEYLPLSTWKYTGWNYNGYIAGTFVKTPNLIDGKIIDEYYAENDITDKRAKKLLEMIDSNQLVYIDNSIFNGSINSTKLYNNFNIKSGQNFKKVEKSYLTIDNILRDYNNISSDLKRIKVQSLVKPLDDENNTSALATRKMKFKVTFSTEKSEQLKIKLYLDMNADGLFKDSEVAQTYDIKSDIGVNVRDINYNLNNSFIGHLDWKIEIKKENGIKTNLLNSSQYKSLIGKKELKVLQVCPNDNFNLSKNNYFKDLRTNLYDYNIEIETKTVDEFNDEIESGKLELNGVYNMIILGFADSYGQEQIRQPACDKLKKFIQTGQSVMFTHDTMTPVLTDTDYKIIGKPDTEDKSFVTGPVLLTQNFRDYTGQSRYKDPYRVNQDGAVDESDIYNEYIKIKDENNKTQIQSVNRKILHDNFTKSYNETFNGTTLNGNAYSLGTTNDGQVKVKTIWLRNYLDFDNSWNQINKVKVVNSAQINNYPFKLDNTISVATTHTQYYQLNLEDPDVVPWFNLIEGTFNEGDARNYYYTYSKGNITYSGTGHSNGFTNDELKLFVNTIVKAERGANNAPQVDCNIPIEYTESNNSLNTVIANQDYSFNVDAKDFDGDPVEVKIKINGMDISSTNVDMERIEDKSCFPVKKDENGKDIELETNVFHVDTIDTSRKPLKVTIPASQLTKGTQFKIEMTGTDYLGAKTNKTYILNPIELPKFDISLKLDTDNLKKIKMVDGMSILDDSTVKIDDKTIEVKQGDIVNVPYNVIANSIEYGQSKETQQKEIAILIDSSMEPSNLRSQCLNGIVNKLITNKAILGNTTNDNTRFVLVVYDSNGAKRVPDTNQAWNNNYSEKIRLEVNDVLNSGNYPQDTSNSSPDISNAINIANEFFKVNDWKDSSKDIIIIANRDIKPLQKNVISDNYNVITLDISNDCYDSGNNILSDDQHKKLQDEHKNLQIAHSQLGGIEKGYFISKRDSQSNTVHNDLNSGFNGDKSVLDKVANGVGYFKYPTFILDNAVVNFNLGSNIDLVKGLTKKSIIEDDTNYIINLPKIKYIAKTDSNGNPITSGGNLYYEAYFIDNSYIYTDSTYNFNYQITPNINAQEQCEYLIPNELTYNYLGYNTQGKGMIDKTPILTLDSYKVDHGVYERIEDGKAKLLDSSDKTYLNGTIVSFASNITSMNGNTNLEITIDDNASFEQTPKVYKVNSDGSLVLLGIFSKYNDKKYTFSGFDGRSNRNIIILYSVKLDGNVSSYTNYATVGIKKIEATIKTKNEKLPDLF